MKSSIRVINLDSRGVADIRAALGNKSGVMACEIKIDIGEINIIYDNNYLNLDDILDTIENLGYSTI